MADVIIPPTYGLAVIKHQSANVGKIATVTWGYQFPTGSTTADNASLIATAITDPTGLFAASKMAAGSVLTSVYVLENRAGVHGSFEVPVNLAGTRTGGAVPTPQVAVGVKKGTFRAGKAFRGRFYLPNSWLIAGDFLSDGTLTGTRQGQLQTAASLTLDALQTADVQMFLLHTAADDIPTVVSSLQIASVVRTQRRRLPR